MSRLSRTGSGLALVASLSMAGSPVVAADLPQGGQGSMSNYAETGYASEADEYERHRRYRYRRHRVDAGDVIAGVVILGGIAAIASAARNAERRDRYDDRRYDNRRYEDRRYRTDYRRTNQSSAIDRAVDSCTRAIARDVRVDSVDAVTRTGNGWTVSGRLFDGNAFTCNVGSDGRIRGVDYSRGYSGSDQSFYSGVGEDDDRQWSDEAYSQARQDQRGSYAPPAERSAPGQSGQPSYPGGPMPGDDLDDDFGG